MTLAIFLTLLAAIGFGSSAIFARLGLQYVRSSTGTVVSLVAGFLLVGTLAVLIHGSEVFALTPTTLLWIAILGFINYPLGRLLYFTSVHLAGITRATPIVSTTPVVAISLGIIAGGETLSPMSAIGTLAIISGIILIVSKRSA